jgi:hypothetical protein
MPRDCYSRKRCAQTKKGIQVNRGKLQARRNRCDDEDKHGWSGRDNSRTISRHRIDADQSTSQATWRTSNSGSKEIS